MKPIHVFLALLVPIPVGPRGLADARAQAPVTRLDGTTISRAAIDSTVTHLMTVAEVPGAGIAILNRGHIVFLRAYGLLARVDGARASSFTGQERTRADTSGQALTRFSWPKLPPPSRFSPRTVATTATPAGEQPIWP